MTLSPTKQALLERLRRGGGVADPGLMRSQSVVDEVALSPQQRRIWIDESFGDPGGLYTLSFGAWLDGPLATAALEASFHALIQRHEVLRSHLQPQDEHPRIRIAPQAIFTLPVIDLIGLGNNVARAEQLGRETMRRSLKLTDPPLFRAMLVRFEAERHLLIVWVHHIAADGWSLGVVIDEINALYAQSALAQPHSLDPTPLNYSDFTVWANGTEAERERVKAADFWREHLAGQLPKVCLPDDLGRPPRFDRNGAAHRFKISADRVQALQDLAREERVSLFHTALAAFWILLARFADQQDVLIASPVANRDRVELERAVGVYMDTIVYRGVMTDNPTVQEILARASEEARRVGAHRQIGYERLIREVRPPRDVAVPALAQNLLVFQNSPLPTLNLPGVSATRQFFDAATAKFDLSLYVDLSADGFDCVFEYGKTIFSSRQVEIFAEAFEQILSEMCRAPGARLGEIELASPTAAARVLALGEGAPAIAGKGLLEAVAEQAATRPRARAVRFGPQDLNYGDLWRWSDRIAAFLTTQGVRLGDRVGLYGERCLALLPILLGVLKAGAAFVPINPDDGGPRIRTIVEDADVRLLISGAGQLPFGAALQVPLELLVELRGYDETPAELGQSLVRPEDLAYLMYTSGSTGAPKAVPVSHANLASFLAAMLHETGFGVDDHVLAISALTFDISLFELFLPLYAGASIELAPQNLARDGQALSLFLSARRPSVMQATPSTWSMLFDAGWEGQQQLRAFSGGEALSVELARRLAPKVAELWNLYGPTEATVWASAERIEPLARLITVGRPIAGTRMLVTDASGQILPEGAIGDLLISGPGVASGYWRRPELTAKAFTPCPLLADAPAYRTGDRARLLPDGRFVVLGRGDDQIKLRGHRLELGEIQAALQKHHAVAHGAVVFDREGEHGGRILAFYVKQHGEASIGEGELRAFLRARLADIMTPSRVVAVGDMPLTASGKIDRGTLLALVREASQAEVAAPPAATALQRSLIDEFATVLGRSSPYVGVSDDFFDKGGDSLMATRLLRRLQERFGAAPSLADFFEDATVAAVARAVEKTAHATHHQHRMPDPTPEVLAALAQTPSQAQHRFWFLQKLEPDSPQYSIGARIRFDGDVNVLRLERALRTLSDRHESLRTRLDFVDGRLLRRVEPASAVCIPVLDWTHLSSGDYSEDAMRMFTQRPFDLAAEVPWRACLALLWDGRVDLLVTAHHSACDGWSMNILIEDLAALYASDADAIAPADLGGSFTQLLVHEQALAALPQAESARNFWRSALACGVEALNLPLRASRPAVRDSRGEEVGFTVSRERLHGVDALARRLRATRFMVLTAAWKTVLWRYCGQSRITLGTPVSTRDARFDRLVACVVNTIPLTVDLDPRLSFAELIARVRATCLKSFDNAFLPFDEIARSAGAVRDLSTTPLFQAMLVVEPGRRTPADFSGVHARAAPLATGAAKYDLTLTFWQDDDGLDATLEFASAIIDDAVAQALVQSLQRVLEEAIVNPETPIGDMDLLSPGEMRRCAPSLSDPSAERERWGMGVEDIFAGWARLQPDQEALRFADRSVSYGELARQADLIAADVSHAGVRPGQFVAVLSESPVLNVAAFIGIMAAGAGFAVIGLDEPPLRLASLLRDLGPSLIYCDEAGRHALTALEEIRAPIVDLNALPVGRPPPGVRTATASDAAYLVYTSGTTGRPKGIVQHRAGLAQFIDWMKTTLPLAPGERIANWAPLHYDASYTEIFAALCQGATASIPSGQTRLDPEALLDWLDAERIVQLQCIPSFWRLVMDVMERRDQALPWLRTMLLAGEALPIGLARRWLARAAGTPLYNLYGPTECVLASVHRVRDEDLLRTSIPIGAPIAERQLLILDRDLRPCPVGVTGEIYIRSAMLAGEYFNRPEATHSAYPTDPWAAGLEGAFYRTGDLGRWSADGLLEFLGRRDYQVKLNGNRIELEEIEAILEAHPDVRECAVTVRQIGLSPALAAFFVSDVDAPETALWAHLADHLPMPLRPRHLQKIAAVPRTSSNKKNRRALPDLDLRDDPITVTPRNELEQQIAEIWRELLGLTAVDVEANFFDLGGHSMAAARMQEMLQARLGRTLRLVELFASPTVASLAAALTQAPSTADQPSQLEAGIARGGARQAAMQGARRTRPVRGEQA